MLKHCLEAILPPCPRPPHMNINSYVTGRWHDKYCNDPLIHMEHTKFNTCTVYSGGWAVHQCFMTSFLVSSHISLSLFQCIYLNISIPCSVSLRHFLFYSLSVSLSLCHICPGMGKDCAIPLLMSHLSPCVTVWLSDQPWGNGGEITVLCITPQPTCHFQSALIPPDGFPSPQTPFHLITHEAGHSEELITVIHIDSCKVAVLRNKGMKCARQKAGVWDWRVGQERTFLRL